MINDTIRDVSITFLTEDTGIIVACDSSAAIGLKEADSVLAAPEITSAFCLRVALMELLAIGGIPIIVVDTIGGEMEPTGTRMITGIRNELIKAGLTDVMINGSTEENMETKMTSIGVTVVGTVQKNQLRYGTTLAESTLYQVGEPLLGADVLEHRDAIFTYQDLAEIQQKTDVLELLPVGSKGVAYEAEQLARSSGLHIIFDKTEYEDTRSAGPATVLLVAVEKGRVLRLTNKKIAVKRIGYFTKEQLT
ncbi:hypothetical protein UAY_01314 [Enterococcus moraviensis ATCC BAA-383]|uniref:PurM-like N-terminal domain-containing protein n=1 Tax=Enterococcus moraviensis ATCC BAA-383 TaxID=1158609 RepID=R2R2M2_9ENTE|nr:hypothetical protein [Enterococcus moraviensis]EOI01906.1 hypothetical protein UAY_01314 [Enterococcus moraviensis ATCC BAA-383]EOT73559.1 hypothetical protein I586_00553 [Enterococcus moraviensis ATCC BAA-383]